MPPPTVPIPFHGFLGTKAILSRSTNRHLSIYPLHWWLSHFIFLILLNFIHIHAAEHAWFVANNLEFQLKKKEQQNAVRSWTDSSDGLCGQFSIIFNRMPSGIKWSIEAPYLFMKWIAERRPPKVFRAETSDAEIKSDVTPAFTTPTPFKSRGSQRSFQHRSPPQQLLSSPIKLPLHTTHFLSFIQGDAASFLFSSALFATTSSSITVYFVHT